MHTQARRFVHTVVFTIIAICVCLCLFNAYITGKSQDLDGKLNYGAENDIFAITIAISESVYGFHEGYVGRPEVEAALKRVLMPEDAGTQQLLAGNKRAIESAFQAAVSLDPATFQPFKSTRAPFVIMPAEDTGLVDFYRLAFGLFGTHADAMYQTFFLLLGISSLLFLLQARHQLWAAGLLVIVLFSFNMLFYLDTFVNRVDAPSVTSNRNLGILGIVPALHLMLFSGMQSRYASVTTWVMWVLQAALLIFVVTVRSSALWQWILLLAWIGAPLLWACWRNWRKHSLHRTWKHKQRALIALMALLGMQHITGNERLERHDNVYFSDCSMPRHMRWHGAYMALSMHPEWAEYAPAETGGVIDGSDRMAWNVAEVYWKRKNPDKPYVCKAFPRFYLLGVHDKIMARAFRHFARKHPTYIWELYFIHKPKAVYKKLQASMNMLPAWWRAYVLYFAGAATFLGFTAALAGYALLVPLLTSAAAMLSLLLMSNLPHLFAYPVYMAETLWLLLACMGFALCLAAMAAGVLLGMAARKAFLYANARLPAEDR